MARETCTGIGVFLLILTVCQPGFSQGSGDTGAQHDAMVKVEQIRQMREDVDLWPLILHPRSAAERPINATLSHLNVEFTARVRDCLSGKFSWSKESFTGGEWSRKTKVTMQGPRFLSMVSTDGFYCGTAHPDDDPVALVFDLKTGEQMDWSETVSKSAGASLSKDEMGDEGGTFPLRLPELQQVYAAAEDSECRDYFKDQRSFVLWPDAGSGMLIAEVAGLPHVAAPCKNEYRLTMEQARKLGFSEELLEAILDAHRIAATKPMAQ